MRTLASDAPSRRSTPRFLHRFALKNGVGAPRDLEALFRVLGFYPEFFRFSQKELFFQCLLHQAEQFFGRIRLANEMVGAAFDRLDALCNESCASDNYWHFG